MIRGQMMVLIQPDNVVYELAPYIVWLGIQKTPGRRGEPEGHLF